MSWIKLEKDLRRDVRVLRMAAALNKEHACNGAALQGVTLVLGGLTQLWMYADSFARDDDSLDITVDEIDQLTGIKGFAQVMPADWLVILDKHTVKLPGFQAHNGTVAKKKALTARRVAHHRNRVKRSSVTTSNAPPLPDQTVPDLDQTIPIKTPEGVCESAWQEWVAHRRKRRWPVDPTTLGKQTTLLLGYSQTIQREIIDSSINSGWQGLFAPKGKAGKSPAPPAPLQDLAERNRQIDREYQESQARYQAGERK